MDGLEEKLNAILNNPQMMQQVMSLAQSIGPQIAQPEAQESKPPAAAASPTSMPDLSMLSRIGSFTQKMNLDQEQRSLLKALAPYLAKEKIAKLERAMQAARMAQLASNVMGNGGLQKVLGR